MSNEIRRTIDGKEYIFHRTLTAACRICVADGNRQLCDKLPMDCLDNPGSYWEEVKP